MLSENLNQRRAVEALRAGVPNRDVVRQLKPMQPDLEKQFDAMLQKTASGWENAKQEPGLLIEGGFGTGKSHCMEYLRHLALENNFVCSTLVLNKEMPLHNLARVYRGAVESAAIRGKTGSALAEIVNSYHTDRAPHYPELYQWVHRTPDLDPRLAATLFLFQDCRDEDLREKIVAEWTGYPMKVQELKVALKEANQLKSYNVARPQTMKIAHRFEFLSRFFRSAGYNGWVILFDETEIISRYSLQQRGKAYAHLAQLMGHAEGTNIPGLVSVFAITDDYAGQVLQGRKNDICNIPEKVKDTKEDRIATHAKAGMEIIESKALQLRTPTATQVLETYDKVRTLYADAYAWDAPQIENMREYSLTTRMREHVRSWINTWDLRRLYNYQAQTTVDAVTLSYEEDVDLQTDAHDEDETESI